MRTSASQILSGASLAIFLLFPVPSARAAPEEPTSPPERKRLVLFLQRDGDPIVRSRAADLALNLVETCSASRSLAVVSFDERFRLHQDFTDQTDELRRAILDGEEVIEPSGSGFSLAASLDASGRRPSALKPSLTALARALRPVGTETSIVFIGRGIPMGSATAFEGPSSSSDADLQSDVRAGDWSYAVQGMDREFLQARSALKKAGLGLFAVKMGGRAFDPGLDDLAGATGGRYFVVGSGQTLPLQLKKSLCEP
jgi:hypothetical protein